MCVSRTGVEWYIWAVSGQAELGAFGPVGHASFLPSSWAQESVCETTMALSSYACIQIFPGLYMGTEKNDITIALPTHEQSVSQSVDASCRRIEA